jgi:glycosyltransferase involved in cell wall biosynthesis
MEATPAVGSARPAVLFVVSQPFFEWRGSPIRVGFDLRALVELGYDVTLLTLPFGIPQQIPGVRIVRAPRLPGVRGIGIGPSFLKLVYDALFFFLGVGLCRRRRFAVVHGVEDAAFPAALLALLFGARFVYEKHSDPRSYRGGAAKNLVMALYGALERLVIGRADAVIGTGPGLVDQVRQARPGVAVHHIFDIPSSLREADPGKAAAIAGGLRRTGGDVLALYVGSFASYQGVDLLFEAIPAAVAAAPQLRFVIVGGTAEQIARRRKALAAEGVADAVVFAGFIAPDELPDHLAAADILISPRIAGRNTPLKILDYLKAGRAILATDTEANRLLLDESTALLVPPEPRALAAGAARLAADPGLRRELERSGRGLIASRYNFREFTRLLGECYRGALGAGSPR